MAVIGSVMGGMDWAGPLNDVRGTFDVIVADPPWSYRKSAGHGVAGDQYSTMSIEDIMGLNVARLAAKNCALCLWGTWPLMAESLQVIESWGFRFVTCLFVWRKTYASGLPYMGLGHYTRSGSEFCLLAAKGSVPVASKDIHQVVDAPVTRHSQKPAVTYSAIEILWPNARRLELFSRRRWPGWDAWGDQVGPALPLFQVATEDHKATRAGTSQGQEGTTGR